MNIPRQPNVETAAKRAVSRLSLDGSHAKRSVSGSRPDPTACGTALLPAVLAGLFTMAFLAGFAARAQSIYSSPAPFITIAGLANSPGADDGTNSAARFYYPEGVAEDIRSNLYVVDTYENTIRKIAPVGTSWVVTTIAGTPNPFATDADGTNGAAAFESPVGIAVDTNGNLYVGENYGSTIRKITPVGTNWVVTTIAGQPETYSWADGTNTAALFNGPQNLTVGPDGNLYVADSYNSVIRKITPVGTNWVVTTIAGQHNTTGYADGTNTAATFDIPYGLAFDPAGNLYVSDDVLDFGGATIRKLTPSGTNWVVTTIAGLPTASGSADGTNQAALFKSPLSVAADIAGNLYVADSGNHTIREITPSGTNWVVSTIAGVAGQTGSSDGTGTNALFSQPWGATVDTAGHLFVTDTGSRTIRLGLVQVALPPMAGFSGTPTHGSAPMVVTFANLSSNATNYVWDFGDGNVLSTSSNTNVTETYTNAGTYTVSLTAYGPGGVSALTNTGYIVVTSSTTNVPNPTVQFIGPNTVLVSWPGTGDYVLQTNGDLTTPHWADYGGPVTTTNGVSSATFDLSSGTLFFRLRAGTIQPPPTVPNPTVQFIGPNTVMVSWPGTGDYVLQTNGDLTTPQWADYGGPVTTTNGVSSATFDLSSGTLFFRLRLATGQTVSVPNLAVALAPNRVEVSWPATGTFTLQTNVDLTTTNWGDYGGTITSSNGAYRAAFTPSAGSLFFRLRQ
jgi:PKD repeat protein